MSMTLLELAHSFFASATSEAVVAVKSGGACGGVRYCAGAMVDVVIGAVAVQGGLVVAAVAAGRRWW